MSARVRDLLRFFMSVFFHPVINAARTYLNMANRTTRIATQVIFGLNFLIVLAYFQHESAHAALNVGSPFYPDYFSLSDESIIEQVGYCLEFLTAIMFAIIAKISGHKFWNAWAGIFVIILLDDSLHYHEAIGHYIQDHYGIWNAKGEIIGFSLLGIPVTTLCLYGLKKCWATPYERGTYLLYTVYLGLLIFFGVFFDALHVVLWGKTPIPDMIFELAEDGMEQVMVSVSALTTLGLCLEVAHKKGYHLPGFFHRPH